MANALRGLTSDVARVVGAWSVECGEDHVRYTIHDNSTRLQYSFLDPPLNQYTVLYSIALTVCKSEREPRNDLSSTLPRSTLDTPGHACAVVQDQFMQLTRSSWI